LSRGDFRVAPSNDADEPRQRRYDPAVHDAPTPRLTLPSGSRVRRHAEVRRAFDHGRSAAAGPVVAYAFDRDDGAPARYALVVGKRWGGAVQRNRIRRLLRESFRLTRPDLPPGFDVILLPRDAFTGARLDDVRPHVRKAVEIACQRFRRDGPGTPRHRDGKRRRR
jgi:ribonuclease P protein component